VKNCWLITPYPPPVRLGAAGSNDLGQALALGRGGSA
jgi:hypothetical protein